MSLIYSCKPVLLDKNILPYSSPIYIRDWNLRFYWGLVEMETSVVENPIRFFQAAHLLSLQVWLGRGRGGKEETEGGVPAVSGSCKQPYLGPPLIVLLTSVSNTATYLRLNNKRWMVIESDWLAVSNCGLIIIQLWWGQHIRRWLFGKEPLLPVPKREGRHIMQGHRGKHQGGTGGRRSEGKRCAKADIVVSVGRNDLGMVKYPHGVPNTPCVMYGYSLIFFF